MIKDIHTQEAIVKSRSEIYVVLGVPESSGSPISNTRYNLQPGHYSSLPAPKFQPTATQERDDQCGNQHYSRELLVMGIVVPKHVQPTRSAIK